MGLMARWVAHRPEHTNRQAAAGHPLQEEVLLAPT